MSSETSYDSGAPTIEVRIYRDDVLLVRELCETEEDAAALVEQWSDAGNVYVVVDDLSARHGPEDILAPDDFVLDEDEGGPLSSATLPGYGTE